MPNEFKNLNGSVCFLIRLELSTLHSQVFFPFHHKEGGEEIRHPINHLPHTLSHQKGISALRCTTARLSHDILLSNFQMDCIKDINFLATLLEQCLWMSNNIANMVRGSDPIFIITLFCSLSLLCYPAEYIVKILVGVK